MNLFAALAAALFVTACGGSASPAASLTATPASPGGTSTATASAAAGLQWTVTDASKASVSVREQLVGLSLPSDAVLVAKGAKGGFAPNDDGTFAAGSKITFDLTTLTSDQSQRDSFVKRSVLGISQFPTAVFVPTNVTGVTLPLVDGNFSGTLTGTLTIRGISKDVTFAVKGTRAGNQLTVSATVDPVLTFGQFGMEPPTVPGRVLSIVDAIRLVVDIVATSA